MGLDPSSVTVLEVLVVGLVWFCFVFPWEKAFNSSSVF